MPRKRDPVNRVRIEAFESTGFGKVDSVQQIDRRLIVQPLQKDFNEVTESTGQPGELELSLNSSSLPAIRNPKSEFSTGLRNRTLLPRKPPGRLLRFGGQLKRKIITKFIEERFFLRVFLKVLKKLVPFRLGQDHNRFPRVDRKAETAVAALTEKKNLLQFLSRKAGSGLSCHHDVA